MFLFILAPPRRSQIADITLTLPDPAPICRPEHRRRIVAAAVLASSMGFIDSSVTAIALPAIRASLGGTLEQAQWVSGAYLLTLSALILVGGATSDRFGIVRVFAAGIVTFVVSSMFCMLAQSMDQMNIARAVQGIGAAFMVPGSMTLIARAHPRKERGAALGLWAAAATATTAAGPLLGGLLLTFGGPEIWRAVFALNLPLGIGALWLLWRYTMFDAGLPGTRIDWPGAALATLALGLMARALTTEGHTLPLLAGAVLASLLFVWRERATPDPMIRLGMFRNRGFALANLATLFLYIGVTGVMFYLPMTALSVWNVSAFLVTAAFVPVSLLITLVSARAGRWADRFGPGPLMALGSALVSAGYAGMAWAAPGGHFLTQIVPFMCVVGLGMALVVAPLTAAVMEYAIEAEQGVASGINNALARVSGLIAVALMGRVARWSYGPVTEGMPGFGLPGAGSAHVSAVGAAFGDIAAVSAVLALAAAVTAAMMGRRQGAAVTR
ncbi:MAG: MFS transporter [Alphaproteobacteria bacterium]